MAPARLLSNSKIRISTNPIEAIEPTAQTGRPGFETRQLHATDAAGVTHYARDIRRELIVYYREMHESVSHEIELGVHGYSSGGLWWYALK